MRVSMGKVFAPYGSNDNIAKTTMIEAKATALIIMMIIVITTTTMTMTTTTTTMTITIMTRRTFAPVS